MDYSHKITNLDITPIKNHILVESMEYGEFKTKGGIIIANDDGKDTGIRPRWAKVFKVGKEEDNIKVGQWVLVQHGRWTRGILQQRDNEEDKVLRMVENESILLTCDESPLPN